MDSLYDNEDFFQAACPSARLNENFLEIVAGPHNSGTSRRHALWENTIVAGSVEHLAGSTFSSFWT